MSDERWIPGGEEEPVSPAEQMPQPVRPAAMRSFDEDPDAPGDPDALVVPEFSEEDADWRPPAPVVPVFDEADAGATDPDSTPKVVSFDPDAHVEAEDAQPYSDMPEPEGGSSDEAFRPGADEAGEGGADSAGASQGGPVDASGPADGRTTGGGSGEAATAAGPVDAAHGGEAPEGLDEAAHDREGPEGAPSTPPRWAAPDSDSLSGPVLSGGSPGGAAPSGAAHT